MSFTKFCLRRLDVSKFSIVSLIEKILDGFPELVEDVEGQGVGAVEGVGGQEHEEDAVDHRVRMADR